MPIVSNESSNAAQDRIDRVLQEMQAGTLTDEGDIQFFLKRVRKGEYPNFSIEDAQKTAELIKSKSMDEDGKTIETEKVLTGTKVNKWVRAKKERLANKVKNRLEDTKVLEIQKEMELKAVRLSVEGFSDYRGSDEYKHDMERVKEAAELIKTRKTKVWEVWKGFKKYRAKKFEEKMTKKLDPLGTLNREIARRGKASPIRAYQKIMRYYLSEKKVERLQKREEKRQVKITKLENKIGRSSWYKDWGSKIKLGFHRARSESNRGKLIDRLPLNDAAKYEQALLAKRAELQTANNWNPETKKFDKTLSKLDFKRLNQQMEKIDREMGLIESQREVLKPQLAEKFQAVEDRLNPKIEKKRVRLEELSDQIDIRNTLLTQRTEYRKAAEYLASTNPDLKKDLEGIIRDNTERQITTDKDFIKTLREAGVTDEMMKDLANQLQKNPNQAKETNNPDEKPQASKDRVSLNTEDSLEKYQETLRDLTANLEKKSIDMAVDENTSDEFKAKLLIAAHREGIIIDNVDPEKLNSDTLQGLTPETLAELRKMEAERRGETREKVVVNNYVKELVGDKDAVENEGRFNLAEKAINASDEDYAKMKENYSFVHKKDSHKEINDMDNLRTINQMNKLLKQTEITPQDLKAPDKTEFNKKFAKAMDGFSDDEKKKLEETKDRYLNMSPEDKKRARLLGMTVKQLSTMDPSKRKEVIKKTIINTNTMARGTDGRS